jgi:hypothetical protein
MMTAISMPPLSLATTASNCHTSVMIPIIGIVPRGLLHISLRPARAPGHHHDEPNETCSKTLVQNIYGVLAHFLIEW